MLRAGLRATGAVLRIPGAAKLLLARTPLAGLIGLGDIDAGTAGYRVVLGGLGRGAQRRHRRRRLRTRSGLRLPVHGRRPVQHRATGDLPWIPAGGGGTQRLTRLLGAGKALQMCLEGTPKTPTEALAFGLVDRVVAPERLLEEAVQHATQMGRRPKAGIGAVKRAVRVGGSLPLRAGLRIEAARVPRRLSDAGIDRRRARIRQPHKRIGRRAHRRPRDRSGRHRARTVLLNTTSSSINQQRHQGGTP